MEKKLTVSPVLGFANDFIFLFDLINLLATSIQVGGFVPSRAEQVDSKSMAIRIARKK